MISFFHCDFYSNRKYLIIFLNSTSFREIPVKIGTQIDEFLFLAKLAKKIKIGDLFKAIFKQKVMSLENGGSHENGGKECIL